MDFTPKKRKKLSRWLIGIATDDVWVREATDKREKSIERRVIV